MSKKIKQEDLQDLTTEQLAEVVEGAIVEIFKDELTVLETPEVKVHKVDPFESKVFEFQARGHNHNAIAAMLGVDSDLVKKILDSKK